MSTTINKNSKLITKKSEFEISNFEVDGTGRIIITNTGGASASEGGMGTGSDDDREKGSLSKPGEKSGSATTDDEDTTFDPIKKNAREAEKERDKE